MTNLTRWLGRELEGTGPLFAWLIVMLLFARCAIPHDFGMYTAVIALWDLGTMEALDTADELGTVQLRMQTHHSLFAGLSMQSVSEFNELWRGKVTTLLKTSEGTK